MGSDLPRQKEGKAITITEIVVLIVAATWSLGMLGSSLAILLGRISVRP